MSHPSAAKMKFSERSCRTSLVQPMTLPLIGSPIREMTPIEPPRVSRPALHKRAFRRLIEFRGFQRLPLQQYRSKVRRLYDGPAGAMLMLASLVSLHQPLIGRMLRKQNFDLGRFQSILDVGSGA